jgi:hypothetical protein
MAWKHILLKHRYAFGIPLCDCTPLFSLKLVGSFESTLFRAGTPQELDDSQEYLATRFEPAMQINIRPESDTSQRLVKRQPSQKHDHREAPH